MKPGMRVRTWGVILATAGMGGCLGILGLDDRPTVLVRFGLQLGSGEVVTLQTNVGGTRFSLADRGPGDKPTLRDVRVPRTGTLPVRVAALLPGADTLARAEFTAEYRDGYVHWITVEIGSARPGRPCQQPVAAVPLARTISRNTGTRDTLFVLAGSMPKGGRCSDVVQSNLRAPLPPGPRP